ncbi:MAG: DNA polymerase III subunit [Ignavibacteriales bacterium]|nr:DNA polymerase III subunit [Ignavibacteriales bacterium]
MSWNSVIGQERVKKLLKRAMETGQLAHSYLFYGSEGVGKDATAIEFAKALNCISQNGESCGECSNCKSIARLQHPNVKLIFALPTTKEEENDTEDSTGRKQTKDDSVFAKLSKDVLEEIQEQIEEKAKNPYFHIEISKANAIRIASIRDVKRELSLSLFSTGKRVVMLLDADMMNEEAQNAFLKTLEEPPPETIIILTSSRVEKLKPTIISRCQQISFDVLHENDIINALSTRQEIPETQARILAQLANGNYRRATELLGEDLPARREEVVQFLRLLATKTSADIVSDVDTKSKSFTRQEAAQFLILLLFWFRDVFVLQHQGAIINVDQKEPLERFVQRYQNFDAEKAYSQTENTLSLVLKNVYIRLALTTLALDLQAMFQSK